ncbi:hypothetical protein DFS34DRAFT_121518 [Phlyctochytrium arcticum]|nr:hypothetical protein DFS34DRAFT_121518 [Phlyctochytrium arcticum]
MKVSFITLATFVLAASAAPLNKRCDPTNTQIDCGVGYEEPDYTKEEPIWNRRALEERCVDIPGQIDCHGNNGDSSQSSDEYQWERRSLTARAPCWDETDPVTGTYRLCCRPPQGQTEPVCTIPDANLQKRCVDIPGQIDCNGNSGDSSQSGSTDGNWERRNLSARAPCWKDSNPITGAVRLCCRPPAGQTEPVCTEKDF